MSNKKPKKTKTNKEPKNGDFSVVIEGTLKGHKNESKEEKKVNNWDCEWDNIHGDSIYFK